MSNAPGDDPVRASTYAIENLKRVVPNLVTWTTHAGDDYSELNELYGEALGMWSRYMGHVVSVIGGVYVDLKTADQDGAVFRSVERARQQAGMLVEQVRVGHRREAVEAAVDEVLGQVDVPPVRIDRRGLAPIDLRHPVFRPFGALSANLGQARFSSIWSRRPSCSSM